MLKKVPSRTHRTKGIRVKHILQILLLLGVCFWLLYQLKHSYDKKATLDENDPKTLVRTQTESEHLKLGRKDLPQNDVRAHMRQEEDKEEEALREEEEKHEVEDEKHEAEEREEEDPKHEVEDIEEEHQRREAEEQEEEENKNEDAEDEGKGAGDEEIDENDLETKEGDDHDENIVEEEKEREDAADEKDGESNEDEEREDREDNENSSDDQDNGGDMNAHEAREEHYKGDDASSAVTHDTQVISTEFEKEGSESSNEASKTNQDEDGNQHNMRLVDRTSENVTSSVSAGEEKLGGNSSNPVANSLLDADVKIQSHELPEAESNSTNVSSDVSNNLTKANQETSSRNGTGTSSESAQSQVAAADGMATEDGSTRQTVVVEQTNNTISVEDQLDSSSTIPSHEVQNNVSERLVSDGTVVDGSSNSIIKETTDSTEHEESTNKDATVHEELTNNDATMHKELTNEDASKNEGSANEDATKTEESNDTGESIREDEGADSTNRTEDAVHDDPIDSSDSHPKRRKRLAQI